MDSDEKSDLLSIPISIAKELVVNDMCSFYYITLRETIMEVG